MSDIDITDENGVVRTITTTNTGWMLGVGWMFYFSSLVLNFFYYLIHPSSPELFIWGKTNVLEDWNAPEDGE